MIDAGLGGQLVTWLPALEQILAQVRIGTPWRRSRLEFRPEARVRL